MLTVKETAILLGKSPRRIVQLIRAGQLPAIKWGWQWAILEEDAQAFRPRPVERPAKEHRRIMEEALGRELRPDEVVHHRDHNRNNNAVENLQAMTATEHRRIPRVRSREAQVWETILVQVTPEMKRGLECLKEREFTSISALVRRAITAMYMPMPQEGVHDPRD